MKRFIKTLSLFLILFFIISHGAARIYERPIIRAIENKTHKKFLKWNDIKTRASQYDIIILGSSTAYCAYNPEVLEADLHATVYNMGTGFQNAVEAFYMLKEILKYQKPDILVYDLFLPAFSQKIDYYHVMSNAYFMSSPVKYEMLVQGFGLQGLLHYFFPVFKHLGYMKKDLIQLFSKQKKKRGTGGKWIKGYYFTTQTVNQQGIRRFEKLNGPENMPVSFEKTVTKLERLKNLCTENGIDLILIRPPFPPTRREKTNPDSAHTYFYQSSKQAGLPFYDLNYDSSVRFFDHDFSDQTHMNAPGALKASGELARILRVHRSL